MAKLELTEQPKQVVFGNDSIVIQKFISGIKGGRVLDVADFSEDVIRAGHVIITDGNGVYKPMPVESGAYCGLPEGYKYAGVLYRSILKAKPSASIMTWGEVNAECVPFAMDTIKVQFALECPHISFIKGEEA